MCRLAAEIEELQTGVEGRDGSVDCIAVLGKEEQIVSVAEVMQAGNGFDLTIERSEMQVREKTGDRCAEGDALRGIS